MRLTVLETYVSVVIEPSGALILVTRLLPSYAKLVRDPAASIWAVNRLKLSYRRLVMHSAQETFCVSRPLPSTVNVVNRPVMSVMRLSFEEPSYEYVVLLENGSFR